MTRTLIIDPPVSPYSEPADIRAWIAELEKRKAKSAAAEAEVYAGAIEEAQGWLERARRA